jgi:hypothetical protein
LTSQGRKGNLCRGDAKSRPRGTGKRARTVARQSFRPLMKDEPREEDQVLQFVPLRHNIRQAGAQVVPISQSQHGIDGMRPSPGRFVLGGSSSPRQRPKCAVLVLEIGNRVSLQTTRLFIYLFLTSSIRLSFCIASSGSLSVVVRHPS